MIAQFNRFAIEMTLRQAQSASHQGRCDEDVAALVKHPKIRRQLDKISVYDIRLKLEEYGAWDKDELADHEDNKHRIVWIAAGDIVEEKHNAGRR